jgi:RNA polymerase sigma-70 factor, ECF subfamily
MDKSRLERLLKEHHRDAFLWARQCCRFNNEEAKEVLQMTYLKIFEGKAKYSELAGFKTWLFSVIRYTAIDYSNNRFMSEELDILPNESEEWHETDQVNYKQLLSRLSDRQHEVLLLAFYHGMTLMSIAEVTGLHIGTIRTHYERGKEAMRHLILKESE